MTDFSDTDTKPSLRSITGMWWTIPSEWVLKWTISSCGLTLQLKFDELLAELCAYYLLSCVLGMERKQAEQFSLCPVTKKESFKNTVNRSEKPHTESPGESGVRVRQERLTPKDMFWRELHRVEAELQRIKIFYLCLFHQCPSDWPKSWVPVCNYVAR